MLPTAFCVRAFARHWWLRSAGTNSTNTVRIVQSTGNFNNTNADWDGVGVRPALLRYSSNIA